MSKWREYWSKAHELPYYYNRETRQATWNYPEEGLEGELVDPVPKPDRIHCLHILVKHRASRRPSRRQEHISREPKEAYALLCSIVPKIGNRQEFEWWARKVSDCSSAERGGDLGWTKKEELLPAFAFIAFDMKPGTMTKIPVTTDSGYHLIWRVE